MKSPEELAHLEWLGYVQPVGLVVSIPAMLEAQCYINKNIMGQHSRFLAALASDPHGDMLPEVNDLPYFSQQVLDWQPGDLLPVPKLGALPDHLAALEVILPQYHETLRPSYVVREPAIKAVPQPAEPSAAPAPQACPKPLLLIQELGPEQDFDEPSDTDSARHWHAPPHAKFERLLRETEVPIGLLYNRRQFRLVYAPRGETSGYATFTIAEMSQVAGRPMFAAFQMLLGADRLFNLPERQRLPSILECSRKYQNVVSTALAEQVTSALFELLRGFQAADDQRQGELLRHILADNPQHIYHGLLTVLMRLVFILYAEDRGLISSDSVYSNYYSITGLFERLRSDAGRFPDTMDQRFGAWAQLLTLFRLVYHGGQHQDLKIPARKGYLFEPERFPFLEGRFDDGNINTDTEAERHSKIQIPHISDGVIYRVLEDLLILDGERLSYRTLDVEQIGSVYEAIMGFDVQVAQGKSIAIKPVKSHGAPATINLDALRAAKPTDREKLLKEWTDQKLGGGDATALKQATTIDELVAALEKKIAKHVTPSVVPPASMVFQPSDERRRSGSHYTPRSLTEPIVRTTLEPILKQLCDPSVELPAEYTPSKADKQRYTKGELEARIRQAEKRIEQAQAARENGTPHPSQILDLKVCDPAMGSGAFLVEACRQLGDELIKSWYAHDLVPTDIPPDEDEVLYARRKVAQRCLYGVDKNIMAVDLAKLSLWLVTLAKDHPFTFLDHALRHGDTLVGLTREQIIGFHWEPKKQMKLGQDELQKRLDRATEARAKILNARDDVAYRDQEQRLQLANDALDLVRLLGNACVSCFFAADKKKAREEELSRVYDLASTYLASLTPNKQQLTTTYDYQTRQALQAAADRLLTSPHPIPCFHWEIEFPEVFSRDNGGFDAFVGNPPFLGGLLISELSGGPQIQEWLKENYLRAFGNCDLCAYFFRRAFDLGADNGTMGFLATKTICEGGTRTTGLQTIVTSGGRIYNATRTMKWPGEASVLVACVHIAGQKCTCKQTAILDRKVVPFINSRLHCSPEVADPVSLVGNELKGFYGTNLGGIGFVVSPADFEQLSKRGRNAECLYPCLGGQDVNQSVTQSHERYAISFGANSLAYAEQFPDLLRIVSERVKPERERAPEHGPGKHGKKYWWQHTLRADPLYAAIRPLSRCLVTAITTTHLAFSFQSTRQVFTHSVVVFAFDRYAPFSCLQSRVHLVWTELLSSSLGLTMRYSVRDAFQTFPLPRTYENRDDIEEIGATYYKFRSSLMRNTDQGLTATYNRFHSPDDRDLSISELRRLHSNMDVAVLRAYGWDDLADQAAEPDFCQFLLDYEEEGDEPVSDSSSRRQKKKPWRYRWPDDFRDEVLARLLELNEQRHKEEQLTAQSTPPPTKQPKPRKTTKKQTKKASSMFEVTETQSHPRSIKIETTISAVVVFPIPGTPDSRQNPCCLTSASALSTASVWTKMESRFAIDSISILV